jgi:hypothetical protein
LTIIITSIVNFTFTTSTVTATSINHPYHIMDISARDRCNCSSRWTPNVVWCFKITPRNCRD